MTRCWGLGGGQVWVQEFAKQLADLGHDVRVVFVRSWWPGMRKVGREGIDQVARARYRAVVLDAPLFLESCRLTMFLRGHLESEPADVVVSTGSEAALMHLVRRAGEPRHVASFHATYPDWISFRRLVARSINLTRSGIARTYSHWAQHLDRFSLLRADRVVCSSQNQLGRVVEGLGVPGGKVKLIYVGVDVERFFPCRVRLERPVREILYAGGPWPSKGIDVLLEAFAKIHWAFPDARISVVGGGDWAPYREKIEALGLSDCVRNYGNVAHHEMGQFYRRAYLLAAPTKHESFGLVVAEAMACGLPVVSTRVTSIPEVVADGVTGILVPVDNPGALADALASLLKDPGCAAAMGCAGRARVKELFAWDKIIRQWEQLMFQVAHRGVA